MVYMEPTNGHVHENNPSTLLEISGIPSGIHSNSPGSCPGTGLIKSVALMECHGSGGLGKFLGLNTSYGSPNGQRIWAQTQIRFVRFGTS